VSDSTLRLINFVNDLIYLAGEGNDFSGDDIQEMALEHGVLTSVIVDKPCGEICACREAGADFPTECYMKNY